MTAKYDTIKVLLFCIPIVANGMRCDITARLDESRRGPFGVTIL